MYPELAKRLGSRVKRDEPLSKHTTFRIGGPADALIEVDNVDELRFVLDLARKEDAPLRVLGGGSNVLVREAGVRGIVVRLLGDFRQTACRARGAYNGLFFGAGLSLAEMAAEAMSGGSNNLCWTAGIPGTLGGAIVGNAGAWGHDVGEFVECVHVMNRTGEVRVLGKDEVKFGYRYAEFPEPGLIILGAELRLADIDAPIADPKLLYRDYVERKRRTQPLEHPSAGSVFKNPAPDQPAGLLIDRAGCKGLRVEGACVSPKHANFIVNDRHATGTDVMQLIEAVRGRVKETSGVMLELEIQVW